MDHDKQRILRNNNKIDRSVVAKAEKLSNKLPDTQKPKQGSNYKITPPFGGQSMVDRKIK